GGGDDRDPPAPWPLRPLRLPRPPRRAQRRAGVRPDSLRLPALCAVCARPKGGRAMKLDLTPGSPEWARRITASKVAAILGLSPWESPRSLWHRMHGDLPREESTDAQRRGHYLEPAILAWWRDQHDVLPKSEVPVDGEWVKAWEEQPTYTLGDWAAATPDARAWVDGADAFSAVLVEAKSTAQEWDEPPAYYLTQVIWQMHVSGIHRCHVPVIGPRLTFTEWVIDYTDYADDAALIEKRAREFYDSLAADEPPPLDDTPATYEAVRKVHAEIDRGESVELTD